MATQTENKAAVTSASSNGVSRSRVGSATYLAPVGLLTSADEVRSLADAIAGCQKAWETHVVLDLSAVPLLSSLALDVMLDGHEALTRVGGSLRVVNANLLIREILRLTGLDQAITAVDAKIDGNSRQADATMPASAPLGQRLLACGLLSEAQLEEAIRLQQDSSKRIGQIVVDKGWVKPDRLHEVLAGKLNIPFVQLRAGLYDPALTELVSNDVCRRLVMLPLFRIRSDLFTATADPHAAPGFGELEERTRLRVRPIAAGRESIVKAIADAYSDSSLGAGLLEALEDDFEVLENQLPDDFSTIDDLAAGSPVINMVNSIVQRAVSDKASDIHIEPSQKKARVRFRIDGLLYEVMTPRIELHPAIVSRLKVMANLDIAERRLPQDGRIQVYTQGRQIDLRFSSLPGLYGEKVVLRVLDKNQAILDVNRLGMAAPKLNAFQRLLDRSYGLVLVTGPTGSGKTTTLYSAVNYLNSIEKNIVTIEDPVEYQLDVVNQNPVKEQIGLTFARMLKHVLRQDPDVIMVGEIRERETAEIAVQAALTGHLVLSTLHTNDSVGAITRMIDMGVEPYLLSSALIGVVAQRLVRRICPACKTEYLASPELIQQHGWQDRGKVKLARGRGCPECYDSGYRGRLAVHEVVGVDADLQRLIVTNPSRDDLRTYLEHADVESLFEDGLSHVLDGTTTLEELARVMTAET